MFVGGNTTLNSTSIGGPLALGGNLTLGTSSFNVASQNGGTFTVSGDAHPTGLLVGGNVNWASGGSNSAVNVQSNDYVKIGDMTGSAVLTNGNTHVLPSGPGHSFDSHPQIAEVVNQTTAVNQSGLIGFSSAFSTFRANSANLASCTGTVVLTGANGTPLPATLPPSTNAYVVLTSGVQNVLNITAANLANIKLLQFNNNNSPVPTASTPLIINVDTTGVGNNFNWATPPNFNGLQNASAAYILWNFPTATTLTLGGSSTIPGTIYAPGSTVAENDQNGLNGGVIAGAYTQGGPNGSFNGGQVTPSAFNTTVQSCAAGQVTIYKTADVTTATPGSTVHYTITVTNSGTVPYAGASFTDPLSGVIDDATYNGDATATAGSVSFISLNITWTGDLAVGAVATIKYSVTVRSPDPGDGILSNTVTSTAGSNCATGSTDSRCTATVPVSALTIVKTANATSAVPGQVVAYTITVSNTGHAAYTGAAFTDPLSDVLDDATYGGGASATSGTVSFASPNLTWTGVLAVGAIATITYSVTVNSTQTGNGVLANTVTSTAAGSDCPSGSKDSRCTATVSLTALTIVKTADMSSAAPGSIVHYTIKVTDTGQTAISGATFTDPLTTVLDDATYNNDVGWTAGVASFSSPNVTWTGNLAIGASATVTYSVTISNPNPVTGALPGNGVLSNAVTSTTAGSNCLSGSADVRCTATVTVTSLRIVKSADVSTTSPGSVVHYTITVTNKGQTTYTGATFTDPLGGVLDDASYNGDGAVTPTAGRVTYTSPNLTWTGNLAVGASATITYSVTVNSPDAGDKTLANTVVSSTPGTNCPAGGTDANCSVAVRDFVPALNIVASADVSTTTPGSTVHYTITVKNTGDSDYAGATFTDPLAGVLDDASGPTNAAGGSGADASTGTATFVGQNLTWTGDLAAATVSTPGASATIAFSVTVNKPDTGDRTLASTVTSPTAGSNCPLTGGSDPRCATTVLVQQLTISVGTNAPGGTVAPGGVLVYTFMFTNAGQVPYTGIAIPINTVDVFDDAVPNGDATASCALAGGGTCAPGTRVVTAAGTSWMGDIPVGATVTVTASVTVKNPDPGNGVLRGSIYTTALGSNCPAPGLAAPCGSTVTVLVPGLTITKTADATSAVPGQTVTYTINIHNTGATAYTGVTVTDSLAQMADDATYGNDATATAGPPPTFSGAPDLTLTWTGDVGLGATVTITYSVHVNNPDTGDKLLIDTVSSTATGSTCVPGTSSTACRVTVPVLTPALTITKTASAATTTPGATVTYTITAANTGQTPYAGATFTDDLTGVVDDATYNGATASTGPSSLSYTAPDLTWTANLNVGATATITYTATVNTPISGDGTLTNTVTSATPGSNCTSTPATDPRCTSTVNVSQLTIINTANVTTTTPGSVVRFTATFHNTGAVPYTGITVATNAAGVFDDAVPNGDQTATSGGSPVGTMNLNGTVVSWTGDIPAGGTVTVTGTVTVLNPDNGDKSLASTITTTAPGSNCPAGSTDPQCSVAVLVKIPALTIVKTADTSTTVPGGTVNYTITVTDTGPTTYTAATVSDSFAEMANDATYGGGATASVGTLAYTSPVLTWTGALTPGQSATITYLVTVNNPDTGDKQVINTVTSPDAGATCPPGATSASCRLTIAVLTPALTITKTANPVTTTPGGIVTYTITVTDSGQTSYTGATLTDHLSGVLADATYNYDAATTVPAGGTGSVSYDSAAAAQTVTWTGDLAPATDTAPAQSATITYTVTIGTPATPATLVGTVTSTTLGSNCASGSADTRCTATVTVVSAATLTLTTTAAASTTAGSEVIHTVTAVNTGELPIAEASFTDDLTGVVDDADYNSATASTGTVGFTSPPDPPDLTWSGTVPAAADGVPGTVTITYTVTVHSPDTGNMILTDQLSSAGSNCPQPPPSTGGDPRCTSTVTVSQLAINFSPGVSTTTPGGVVRYTAILANTGKTPYQGISVATDASAIASQATGNGDATADAGTLSVGATGAVWTGDIAPGVTVTVTSSVTVNNPDIGSHILTATAVSDTPGSNCPTGGSDPACTATTTVLTPALTIVKSANTTSAVPGQTVTYTVTVHNTGQTAYTAATAATVTDTLDLLDEADLNGGATASSGSLSFSSPDLIWTGDLALGATVTISYSVAVHSPATGDKAMVDAVTSANAGSTCPVGTTAAACRVTIPVLTPALTITKTADVTTTTPGATVTYTITVTDTGQTAYTGATFTDPLAGVLDDATYVSATVTGPGSVSEPGSGSPPSSDLTWTGNLGTDGSATIIYSVTVNKPDSGNHILASTITSATAGSNCPAGGSDVDCTTTVKVAQLTISVGTDAPGGTVAPGGVVVYTFTFTNAGQVPYTGITIPSVTDDVFDDAVPNGDTTAACAIGATTCAAGTTVVTAAGASWTGDIPVGGVVTVTGSVTVKNPDPGNGVLRGSTYTTAPGSNCPVPGLDAPCGTLVTVRVAGLNITKTANATAAVPGQNVTYTITVTNTEPTPATGVTVTDSLAQMADDAVFNGLGSATASSGSLSFASPNLTWTGDVGAGVDAAVTITYSVDVNNPDNGDKLLINTVTSAAPGSTCPPGTSSTACRVTVPVLTPALTITKTASAATTTPGATVTYTITAANTGQTPYAGATFTDDLTGVVDDATYNGATASTGPSSLSYTAPDLTWTANLNVGATATITYSATVNTPISGDGTLTNTVTSATPGSNCPSTPATDPQCTSTVNVSQLTIINTANVTTTRPGGVVGYTVAIANTGQAPVSDANFTAHFGDVADDTTYNGDLAVSAGNINLDTATASATWTGDLAPGASGTVTGSFTVNSPGTGNKVLSETVDSTTPGTNCPTGVPPGSVDPACISTVDVITGTLSITVPASADLGAADASASADAGLGTVEVTDDRALAGATWTATVSATDFTTGAGVPAQIITAAHATYFINALDTTSGSATFTAAPVTILASTPEPVVTATDGNGDNSATWNPAIQITVPPTAVAGVYTAIITHSVS